MNSVIGVAKSAESIEAEGSGRIRQMQTGKDDVCSRTQDKFAVSEHDNK